MEILLTSITKAELKGSYTSIFFKEYSLCLEKGKGEKKRERNIDVREKHRSVPSHMLSNQGPNLDMCPDWESNW